MFIHANAQRDNEISAASVSVSAFDNLIFMSYVR